jgi:hypothetical protein
VEERTEEGLFIYSSNRTLHLVDRSGKNGSVNLQVLDLGGRVVYSNDNESLHGGLANVPLQHVATGIYIATVVSDRANVSKKVLIQ